MPRVNLPAEGTAACASCHQSRGNQSRGWAPIVRGSVVVGYTCPHCPGASEPIRLIETATGGRFRAVVDATPPGAAQRRQATRTLPTLVEAREWVAEVRAEVGSAGAYAAAASESVAALSERWLASRRDVREITRQGYRTVLVPVLRRIGTANVADVTVAQIEALSDWLAIEGGRPRRDGSTVGLSPRSIRASLVALGQVFDMAAREGVVSRNVVRLARRPRVRQRRGRDLEHWQPTELLRFREYVETDALAGAWRLTLSGLTRADVMGLRWSDVDLDAGIVSISQGRIALYYGDATDDPKSAQRVRSVPVEAMHPGSVRLLRRMSAQQAADRLAAGAAYLSTDYVVVDVLGKPLRPEMYSDRFRRLCSAAGVPSINLHSVRHSLAFWLHQAGVAPADAAALLGHTVEVHLNTYLPHSGAAGITAAARALGQAALQQAAASE